MVEMNIPLKELDRGQARFALAVIALRRLANLDSGSISRKSLFAPRSDSDEKSPALLKEGLSKNWQRAFLEHLIDSDYITKMGKHRHITYKVSNLGSMAFGALITDAVKADGHGVKAILWPDQFQAPDFESDESESDGPESDGPEENSENSEVSIVREIAAQLTGFTTYLQGLHENFQGVHKLVEESLKKTVDVEKRFSSLESKFENKLEKLDSVIGDINEIKRFMQDEDRSKFHEIAARITDFEARRKSLANQIESEGRKFESISKDLEELLSKFKAEENS